MARISTPPGPPWRRHSSETSLTTSGTNCSSTSPGIGRARDCELVPTIHQSLWSSGMTGDPTPYIEVTIERAWSVAHRFDVMHSHLDTLSFSFARHSPVPVLHTLHGRLDMPGVPELLDEFQDIPLVAISESQR